MVNLLRVFYLFNLKAIVWQALNQSACNTNESHSPSSRPFPLPLLFLTALLEKVLYKVVTCKNDAELETSLKMFLPPVLLKMASSDGKVKMKVMEVLGQINKVRLDLPSPYHTQPHTHVLRIAARHFALRSWCPHVLVA